MYNKNFHYNRVGKILLDSGSNQNKVFRPFKSKENIHKNEDGPDCTVLNNKFQSVTLYTRVDQ